MKKAFLILLLSTTLFASFEKKGIGTSTIALSLSGLASTQLSFAIFNNPALINSSYSSEIFYRNYYGIKGFDLASLAVSGSLFSIPASIGITRYGNKLFAESEIAAGVSYALHKDIYVGASVNYYFLDIKNYGIASTLGFSFSVLYKLTEYLRIGGVLSNLNEPTIGEVKESLPVSGTIGISYKPIRDVEILFDGYKEDYFDFAYRIGARINVVQHFNLLTGFQNSINSFSAGLEFNMDSYGINYAIDVHPTLSSSHSIGFKYVF